MLKYEGKGKRKNFFSENKIKGFKKFSNEKSLKNTVIEFRIS